MESTLSSTFHDLGRSPNASRRHGGCEIIVGHRCPTVSGDCIEWLQKSMCLWFSIHLPSCYPLASGMSKNFSKTTLQINTNYMVHHVSVFWMCLKRHRTLKWCSRLLDLSQPWIRMNFATTNHGIMTHGQRLNKYQVASSFCMCSLTNCCAIASSRPHSLKYKQQFAGRWGPGVFLVKITRWLTLAWGQETLFFSSKITSKKKRFENVVLVCFELFSIKNALV